MTESSAVTPNCPLRLGSACYCANNLSSFIPAPAPAAAKTAVLLLAHGTPENPDQIPEYLRYVTGGRPLPPQVVEEIRHRYSLIGFSPLACWTLLQADQLSQELKLPVFVGMRNWKPFIADAVKAIAAQRFERVIAVCLAPQNSRTSVGLYRSAVTGTELMGDDAAHFELDFVDEWHDQPLLAKAFAENLRAGWAKANAEYGGTLPIIFTAHSVPARTITEGDPYEAQSKETAQLVAKAAGLEDDGWTFAFQSQGMSGGAVDRAHRRRNNSEPQSQRPPRSVHSPRRLPLRSRRSALRHRHLLQTVRRKRRHAPMASRIAEWIEDIDRSAGGLGSQPGGSP